MPCLLKNGSGPGKAARLLFKPSQRDPQGRTCRAAAQAQLVSGFCSLLVAGPLLKLSTHQVQLVKCWEALDSFFQQRALRCSTPELSAMFQQLASNAVRITMLKCLP